MSRGRVRGSLEHAGIVSWRNDQVTSFIDYLLLCFSDNERPRCDRFR
jgi:hypothetical protein